MNEPQITVAFDVETGEILDVLEEHDLDDLTIEARLMQLDNDADFHTGNIEASKEALEQIKVEVERLLDLQGERSLQGRTGQIQCGGSWQV